MKKILQKTKQIFLLVLFTGGVCVTVYAAYTKIMYTPVPVEIREVPSPSISTLKMPEREMDEFSSNILMVWKKDDGTLVSYSFNRDEYYQLKILALNVPPKEFETIMEEGMKISKTFLMDSVSSHIASIRTENTEMLQTFVKTKTERL